MDRRTFLTWSSMSPMLAAGSALQALSASPTPEQRANTESLIRQLGSKHFKDREAAAEALRKVGESALAALRSAAKANSDPEVRHRARALVAILEAEVDLKQGVLIRRPYPFSSVAFTPKPVRIVCASEMVYDWVADRPLNDFQIHVIDPASGRIVRAFCHETGGGPMEIAVAPDGRFLIAGCWGANVRYWDLRTGKLLRLLTGHRDFVGSVAFLPDGQRALSGSHDGTMRIWDLDKARQLRMVNPGARAPEALKPYSVDCVRANTKGTMALCCCGDSVLVYDVATGRQLHLLARHKHDVYTAVFSMDGTRIFSGGWDGILRVWDTRSAKQLRAVPVPNHRKADYGPGPKLATVRCLSATRDGRHILSGHPDGTVRVWDAATAKEVKVFSYPAHVPSDARSNVRAVASSPDSKSALSVAGEGTVRLWHL